jgi:ubiquitin-activating enzyme E1
MIDSGTLGTKGNTQVVVPFHSESYGSSRDPPEESIPICTLKNFPNKIEHTIQWAREAFEGYFKAGPEEVNSYLSNPDYFEELAKQPNTQLQNLRMIQDYLVKERPQNLDACIRWARVKFQEEFNNKIQQLLTVFPPDSKDNTGTPFWSGPKRPPEPIEFDAKDPLHLDFVIAAANLRAFNYGIRGETDPAYFQRVLSGINIPRFVPDSKLKIAKTDEEAKALAQQMEDDHDEKVREVSAALPKRDTLGGFKCKPSEFEKDDDKNFHMDFITACSNLRARNYKIKEESKHQTKFIAGKIIPAIATTTALVTGLVCLEIYKLVQTKPLESYQNTYVNLAIPLVSASEPLPPARTKSKLKTVGEWKWSLWDRLEVDLGDCTMQQFLDHFLEKYGLEVNMISYGSSMLYYNFGGVVKKQVKDRLKLPLSKVVEKVAKVKLREKDRYFSLELTANDPESMADVEIPYVRFKFRK